MENTDFRVSVSYFRHPKIMKLQARLGPEGVLSHLRLLGHTAEFKSKGLLKKMNKEDIATAAGWKGKPDEFIQALVDLRLLDPLKKSYRIHNWKIHNSWCFNSRERRKQARKNAKIGWEKRRAETIKENNTKSGLVDGATRIADGKANGNAPYLSSPYPSPPTPSKKEKFLPPTLNEVVQHFERQNYHNARMEAKKFWCFYDSNGWRVGRNAMKNWRSAAEGWNSRNASAANRQPARKKVHFVCPRGCEKDPGVWALSHITSFCVVCEERRIPEKK